MGTVFVLFVGQGHITMGLFIIPRRTLLTPSPTKASPSFSTAPNPAPTLPPAPLSVTVGLTGRGKQCPSTRGIVSLPKLKQAALVNIVHSPSDYLRRFDEGWWLQESGNARRKAGVHHLHIRVFQRIARSPQIGRFVETADSQYNNASWWDSVLSNLNARNLANGA